MTNNEKEILHELEETLKDIKEKNPLTHCITNSVTINDCANAVLAIGGSPFMAEDAEELEEVVTIADALVINIGKLSKNQIESMNISAETANLLDEQAKKISKEFKKGFDKYKEKYTKLKAELEPKITALKSDLAKIQKQVEPKLLQRYMHKRENKENSILFIINYYLLTCAPRTSYTLPSE